jgi:hypothetical protein
MRTNSDGVVSHVFVRPKAGGTGRYVAVQRVAAAIQVAQNIAAKIEKAGYVEIVDSSAQQGAWFKVLEVITPSDVRLPSEIKVTPCVERGITVPRDGRVIINFNGDIVAVAN